MNDKTKKILFAVVFSLLSTAIGFGLYVFFFRPLVSPSPEEIAEGPGYGAFPASGPAVERPTAGKEGSGTLPSGVPVAIAPGDTTEVSGPKYQLLRNGVTQAVSASKDGKSARFYNPEDGRFYRVNPDGTIVAISDKQFFNVDKVSWARRDDRAILEFPDGKNIFYDFNQGRQVTLPEHWQDFSFSPDDGRVAAKSIGLDPSSRFLIVSGADGNEARAVEELGGNSDKVIVDWSPNQQVLAFSKTGKPQAEGGEEIYLIGENGENFKSLIVPGRGFLPNWSPTGKQILYSVYHERDEMKPSLWVSGGAGDSIGDSRRALNLNTWADKCAWRNENEMICGVPQTLPAGAGLAKNNFSGAPDDLYQVNLKTGVSIKINPPDQTRPIRQPVISGDKKKLLFTDAVSGRLYSYDLP